MAAAGKRNKKSKTRGGASDSNPLKRILRLFGGIFFGAPGDEDETDRWQEIKGILLVGFSLWLIVSKATFYAPSTSALAEGHNIGGQIGYYLANASFRTVGWAGYLFALLCLCWGLVLVARKEVEWASVRLAGAVAFVVSVSFLLEFGFGDDVDPNSGQLAYGAGGWLAMEATPLLVQKVGVAGFWFLMTSLAIVSFMVATEMGFYPTLRAFREWIEESHEERGETTSQALRAWFGQFVRGLWDFVRGANLDEDAAGQGSAGTKKKAGKASKKAQNKKKSKKKTPTKRVSDEWGDDGLDEEEGWVEDEGADGEELAEDEEWEYEYEEEEPEEGAEDEEWEYEYEEVAEDDAGEEAEEGAEDEDWEWEYEDGEEPEDEEYEYEEEEEELVEAELKPKKASGKKKKAKQPEDDGADDVGIDELEEAEAAAAEIAKKKSKTKKALKKNFTESLPFEPPTPPKGEWELPPIELLEPPVRGTPSTESKFLEESANKLETALMSFRVDAQVVDAQVGPTVTLFELEVAQGTRMNKVTQLSQEIAAALRAENVRVIAPIPGKATVGIEVPNKNRRIVRLSELVTQQAYDKKAAALPLFLGMDAEGNAVVEDLARMPHLLIAGTTGSGKSVCVNTILASMLLTRSPHDVQMILIDPKMVELQMFSVVPHLMLPVVTNMQEATNVILWAVEKMEGRYELFKDAGVRNIKGYNALSEKQLRERLGDKFNEERTPRHVPYIMLVIDEFADLMMVSKKEAEQAITRLAQKSRAVGIHVILATQRPSTDVITGVIKGNLPTRIAFKVASKVDSRVILDAMGADKLLGGGDMLYTPPQASVVKRVQGALVEDHELEEIIDFVCKKSAPSFSQELVQAATGTSTKASGFEAAQEDPMWDDAVRVILKSKRGSASLLQRALGVGYTRASRLLDMMTEAGIVGAHKGSKAREVMYTIEEWEEMNDAPMEQGVGDE